VVSPICSAPVQDAPRPFVSDTNQSRDIKSLTAGVVSPYCVIRRIATHKLRLSQAIPFLEIGANSGLAKAKCREICDDVRNCMGVMRNPGGQR
jgi:hypothetical protein